MKTFCCTIAFWLLVMMTALAYTLGVVPSPDETNGTVLRYDAAWQYTNTTSTNVWSLFGQCLAGSTNITITSQVPSPARIAVRVVGTNYTAGPFTNAVLYDTNALAVIYTNTPAAPRPAGSPGFHP